MRKALVVAALFSILLSACFLPTRIHEYTMTEVAVFEDMQITIDCRFLDHGEIRLTKSDIHEYVIIAIWLDRIENRGQLKPVGDVKITQASALIVATGEHIPLEIETATDGPEPVYVVHTGLPAPLKADSETIVVSFQISAINTSTQETIEKDYRIEMEKVDSIRWMLHIPNA